MEGVLRKGVLRRGVLMYCFNSRFQLLIKEKKSLSNKCLLINLSKSAPYTYIHTNIIHIRLAPTRSKSWNPPQTLVARRSTSYNALLFCDSPVTIGGLLLQLLCFHHHAAAILVTTRPSLLISLPLYHLLRSFRAEMATRAVATRQSII
jgi:hypothetical protein